MRTRPGLLAALCPALALSGCTALELAQVRESEQLERRFGRVSGTVATGDVRAEWLVVYVVQVACAEDWAWLRNGVANGTLSANPDDWSPEVHALFDRVEGGARLAEHVVLERPGVWWVDLPPGCYGVGAFADLDRDFRYEDEPVAGSLASLDRLVELDAGEEVDGIELVIDARARLRGSWDLVADQMGRGGLRSHDQQLLASVGAVSVEGEVAPLSDPRFAPENARLGYFQIFRFLLDVGPGVYFLEEYDPDRVPVLFVHGALGHPQEFATLIDGLDRSRFQPWVFFYPSGAELGVVAEYLTRMIGALRLRHGFDELAVVAHSMGGLVAREFVLRHHERSRRDPIRVFVSIATPWAGDPRAAQGVERSPWVVPSWRDMKPDSPFLTGLFFEESGTRRRRLPGRLQTHLLFGVLDETIPPTSAIRWEAVREADARWPLPYGHTGVLRSPEASALLNEILDGAH